jgi:hypothetical protein
MTSFFKKPKRKIDVLKEDENTITLKNINIDELNNQYNLKDITETIQKEDSTPKFNIVDEQAVKKVSKFKERITTKKNTSDVNTLTSSLEKLGISNKEIIPTETFFKDNTDRDIKMISHGTNEYITKTCKAHCWWCRHSVPDGWHALGMPIKLKDKIKMEFLCEGIFCSFNCMIAHCHTLTHDTRYRECGLLIMMLYREIFGKTLYMRQIIPAASWKHLREYGGKLTIDEFRNSFNKIQFIERNNIPTMYCMQTINIISQS